MSPRHFFLSISLLTVTILSGLAVIGQPIPLSDSEIMMPPAVAFAHGDGLVNEYWENGPLIEPPPTRLIYHGFLLQLTLGTIISAKEPARILLIWLGVINIINVVLVIGFLLRLLRVNWSHGEGWVVWTSATAIVLAVATFGLASLSRPEVAASIPISLVAYVGIRASRWQFVAAAGIGLGISALISPLIGVLASVGLFIVNTGRHPLPRAVLDTLYSGMIAIIVVTAGFGILYPFPFADWLTGMQRHGKLAPLGEIHFGTWLEYLVFNPILPGLAGPIVLTAFSLVWSTWHRWSELGSPRLYVAGLLLLMALLCVTTLFIPTRKYNLLPLFPIGVSFVLFTWASTPRVLNLFALLTAVPALGFVRTVALALAFLNDGVSATSARRHLREVGIPPQATVGATGTCQYLFDDYRMIRHLSRASLGEKRPDYLVIGQQASGWITPPAFDGYKLITNHFVEHPPRFFGLRLGNTMPGYGFAVYQRMPPQ